MRCFFIVLFLVVVIPCLSQSSPACEKILQFKKLLDTEHINPLPWDDAFAHRTIDQFFTLIDPGALYFTNEEKCVFLGRVENYRTSLSGGTCQLIDDIIPVYQHALTRADNIVRGIQASPLSFKNYDTLRLNFLGEPLVEETQLKTQWLRIIKLGVLLDVIHQGADKNYKSSLDKNCKKYLNVIKRRREVPGGMNEFMFGKLMNAIANSYDPHTAFFSKNEKQSFLDELATDKLSFGIMLDDDALGNIVIKRIVPGSSAWDAGALHENDIVLSIKPATSEVVDATLYSADELGDILEAMREPIEMSVKKVNGEQTTIRLIKQRIREDENKVKSLVLSNRQNRFGYVNLPVFFTSEDTTKKGGCATDLAKEIIQLKKAKIQGLILDLRNNGGGDLEEAIDLAGIFIDRGAIGICKFTGDQLETLKDTNPGVAYDGPLLIMTNGGSASASEIFAAAMRAHHRAILVGSSTYGKGTGQSIIPFGETELVKITSFRFYDPLGKSHQGKGLKPDISLPDLYSLYDFNEEHLEYSLKADSVMKKTYYTALPALPLSALRDSAQLRVAKNAYFQTMKSEMSKRSEYMRDQQIIIPLTLEGVQRIEAKPEGESIGHPVSDRYNIALTTFNEQIQGVDQFGTETFKILIDQVSKDHYIDESLRILAQYLRIQKK